MKGRTICTSRRATNDPFNKAKPQSKPKLRPAIPPKRHSLPKGSVTRFASSAKNTPTCRNFEGLKVGQLQLPKPSEIPDFRPSLKVKRLNLRNNMNRLNQFPCISSTSEFQKLIQFSESLTAFRAEGDINLLQKEGIKPIRPRKANLERFRMGKLAKCQSEFALKAPKDKKLQIQDPFDFSFGDSPILEYNLNTK